MNKVKVGIIGCGNISGIYMDNCQKHFEIIDLVACADLDFERATKKADEKGIPNAYTVEELLADKEIEIVINLTIPKAHAEVSLAALEAGKHVYVEKPLATTLEDGIKVLEKAKQKGLYVGGAPDTFLGGGLQTCRKLIDDDWIGRPIGATAFMLGRGPEGWHPDPNFFYQVGGGPMYDMGPYYLTALIHLMGPVRRVTGSTQVSFPERTIYSQPKYGQKIQVETPTHISGNLEFESGAIGTIITSFDVWGTQLPRLEIYGSNGTLIVPDPNFFDGPVLMNRYGEGFKEVPLSHGFTFNARGLGLADMAYAIRNNRKHRASGELILHVVEIMEKIHTAAKEGKHIELIYPSERPEALPTGITKDNFHYFHLRGEI